jgi:hypothetical protein
VSLILIPGQAPPPLIPYCQRCDMPVERYCMDLVGKEGSHIGIHAQCCGQTSSTRIALAAYLELMNTPGAKLVVIVRKGSWAGIRTRKPTLRSVSH